MIIYVDRWPLKLVIIFCWKKNVQGNSVPQDWFICPVLKTWVITCEKVPYVICIWAERKDSDQPAHLYCLIKVFPFYMNPGKYKNWKVNTLINLHSCTNCFEYLQEHTWIKFPFFATPFYFLWCLMVLQVFLTKNITVWQSFSLEKQSRKI